MNLLTELLPDAVEIDGREFQLNTDFRASLRIILAFEDAELSIQEKYAILVDNLYAEMPANIHEAVRLGLKFLNGGEEEAEEREAIYRPRLYSFAKDGNFIFSAFKQTHGVDLETAEMHWWKFLALFMDLGSETTFCSLVSLRKRVKNGTATKDERKVFAEMGDTAMLPDWDERTPDEKAQEEEFMRLIKEATEARKSNESKS